MTIDNVIHKSTVIELGKYSIFPKSVLSLENVGSYQAL